MDYNYSIDYAANSEFAILHIHFIATETPMSLPIELVHCYESLLGAHLFSHSDNTGDSPL